MTAECFAISTATSSLILRMGAMVEDSMGLSIRALLDRDIDLAQGVIAADDDIEMVVYMVEGKVIKHVHV